MESQIAFGDVQLSFIITIMLTFVYSYAPDLKNQWKILIAVILGLGFGALKIPYDGLPWTIVNVVNNLLQGFMIGAGAVGLNQMSRNVGKQIRPGANDISAGKK